MEREAGSAEAAGGAFNVLVDPARGRFRLCQIHPGHSLAEIRSETGFDFDLAEPLRETEPPDGESLRLIRGPVLEEIAEVYPAFAQKLAG